LSVRIVEERGVEVAAIACSFRKYYNPLHLAAFSHRDFSDLLSVPQICNFASVMAFQNNFSTAEALYRRALTGFESKFSQSQPDGTIVTGRTADTGGGVGHSVPELGASGSSKDVVRGSAGGSGGREAQWEQYMVGCLGSLAGAFTLNDWTIDHVLIRYSRYYI